MKRKLNQLQIKTTNHFNINHLEIDIDSIENNTNKIYDVKGIDIKQEIVNKKITTRIGLEFKKYLDVEITIPKNKVIEDYIYLTFNFSNEEALVSNININFLENSKAKFIIKYLSNEKCFNHLKEVVKAHKYSGGEITYLNFLNSESTNIMAFEETLEEDASITHNLIDIGGNVRIYNAYMESIGLKSSNYFNNIYIGKENDVIDMNYNFKNIGKESVNVLNVEGVLKDYSRKNFRGIIDFVLGCSQAIGHENENCVLLSDTCRSRSLPMLLCHEEDVVGSHGEATGKIGEDKLFYLMSRGLNKEEAQKLIVIANFNKVLNNINNQDISNEVLHLIDNYL